MKTETARIDGWTLRWRKPEGPGPHPVVFLLHGWTGTEDVMWVFAGRLPENIMIVAPRAPFQAPGGFSWVRQRTAGFSSLRDFQPAVEQLVELPTAVADLTAFEFSQVHLMGFSQGAAASYAWTTLYPKQIASVAGLAGFVPDGVESRISVKPFASKPVFMGHGTQDRIVPIERMRRGAQAIEAAGARLTVCEDNVGHKLSANCMSALGNFYNTLFRNHGQTGAPYL